MNDLEEKKTLRIMTMMIISAVSLLFLMIIIVGCTYNVSMVHSEGQSTDAIDTEQEADGTLTPTVTVTPL